MKIYINKGICYTCKESGKCPKPESKSPDGSCDEWEYYKTVANEKTVNPSHNQSKNTPQPSSTTKTETKP